MRGVGRRTPSRFQTTRSVILVASAVALTSCTSSGGSTPSTPSPSAAPASPSVTASPTTPRADDQAAAAWEAFHRERLRQLTSGDDPDPTAFASLATESGAEAVTDLIVVGRGEVPSVVTGSEFWPEIIVAAGGDEAAASDCLLVEQRGEAQAEADATVATQLWTGTLVMSDGQWLVDEVAPGETDCVPAELNTQLLDAYFAWDSAKNSWWDPPDPDHPLIEEVMVGEGLETMRNQLTEHRDEGIVIRDTHDPRTNAVVDRLGLGTAWITDCYPAEEGGLEAYDEGTGELREDLTPPPESGQLDRMVVNLERTEGGVWKVAGWRSGRDATCEPGETPYAVG